MMNTAVIYTSKLGRTRKTAKYIAESVGADIFDLKEQSVIDLSRFDRILIGTGVYGGRPAGAALEFAERNRGQMSGKDVKLFVCCVKKNEEGDAQLRKISEMFGISDAVYFPSSRKKNEAGVTASVDDYIKTL
jgi:menaquinone-dependent protoporphyrinogen oxidase